jgi:hypothetical protein
MSERAGLIYRNRYPLSVAGAVVLLAGGLGVAHVISTEPGRAYENQYTSDGGCLDKTAYDTDAGAGVLYFDASGQEILTVVPEAANNVQPSVLNFMVNKTGFFSVELTPADHQTAGVLVDKCGLTGGT